MGDTKTLTKARQELEDLYGGIPDESVNLTFKDLANIQQIGAAEKKSSSKEVMYDNMCKELKESLSSLSKSPSIDFAKSLQLSRGHRHIEDEICHDRAPPRRNKGLKNGLQSTLVYDDASTVSVAYPISGMYNERGGRRPGIPHTNICTVCSQYIYIFRHRCLVCGRVYCRQCVSIGMGEMSEGRKCIECLGKRFSPRYIERAGHVGCCVGYPNAAKQQELKWAEKGPRRSGERRYGRSVVGSRSISPVGTRNRSQMQGNASFVMNSSTHSPTSHPIPPF